MTRKITYITCRRGCFWRRVVRGGVQINGFGIVPVGLLRDWAADQ
jgi:hypothetical protein